MALKHFLVVLGLVLGATACSSLFVEHYPYPGRNYSDPGVARTAIDYASRTGYRDGFQSGYDDGRGRGRYEPRSYRRYRSGDHGYRRDLSVPRDYYADYYRRSFLSGYDTGFRQGQDEQRRRWR